MKGGQPVVVQQSTIRKYVKESESVADLAALKKARIPAFLNGTAATGYRLVVRPIDSLRAQDILKV